MAPIVSVVMACFNVAPWLEEAVHSVLAQSIGREMVEIILVDDGSTDDTPLLASRLASTHSQVQYFRQANAGAGAARNFGLSRASGTYISFLDPDDLLTSRSFEHAVAVLDQDKTLPFVAMPMVFFEAANGAHPLNIKFKNNGDVVDLRKDWHLIQLSAASAVFRKDILKGYQFSTETPVGEDAMMMLMIGIDHPRYGLAKRAQYRYRKRRDQSSALAISRLDLDRHMKKMDNFLLPIIDQAHARAEELPPFLQFALMYIIGWDAKDMNVIDANDARLKVYIEKATAVLHGVHSRVLSAVRHLSSEQKTAFFEMFLQGKADESKMARPCRIVDCQSIDDGLKITFRLWERRPEEQISATLGRHPLQMVPDLHYDSTVKLFAQVAGKYTGYKLVLPNALLTKQKQAIAFVDGNSELAISFAYPRHIGPHRSLKISRQVIGKAIFNFTNNRIQARLAGAANKALLQFDLLKKSLDKKFYREALLRLIAVSGLVRRERGRILLVDRPEMAGDSAEELFKAARAHGMKAVYGIMDTSPDFERMKAIGPVVRWGSWAHRLELIRCDYLVSSHADFRIFYPEGNRIPYVADFASPRRVFLQHGVTAPNKDQSGWLSRELKNFCGFVVSTEAEKEGISHPRYGYESEHIIPSGLPRFDILKRRRMAEGVGRRVLIAPTWRKSLVDQMEKLQSASERLDLFLSSDYSATWLALKTGIDARLGAASSEYETKLIWHPSFARVLDGGTPKERERVLSKFGPRSYDYPSELIASRVMITDYSSLAYDAVYAGVLTAHYQPDAQVGAGHLYEVSLGLGAVGPVFSDRDGMVEWVVKAVSQGEGATPSLPNDAFIRSDDRATEQVIDWLVARSV